jgi:hypothetical protein
LILALFLLAAGGAVWAQQAGQFGAGVVLGSPLAVTGKYWATGTQAVDFGVGAADGSVFYGTYEWTAWDLFAKPDQGKLGGYVGLGPQVEFADRYPEHRFHDDLGLRTIIGMDYFFAPHPIELFLEAGPVFELVPDAWVNLDIGLGVRFYFAGPAVAAK